MKPRPINEIDKTNHGGIPVTFKCPPNVPDCEPVDVLKKPDSILIPWVPSTEDLGLLAGGGTLWLVIYGSVMPMVNLTVEEPIKFTNKSPNNNGGKH